MGKSKEKKKESQLVIRVEKAEKTAFLALCEALDTSAGREVRRFMRAFVAAKAAMAEAEEDAVVAPKQARKAAKSKADDAEVVIDAPDEGHEVMQPEMTPSAEAAKTSTPSETGAVAPGLGKRVKKNAKEGV
ncbi:hypothetical protein ACTTAI_04060 [Rhodobacter capsulatus]|uniref:hypothetical protein n=1 Tax=Rhodobacter capsulatus TaxID=1061 RepID=UPI004027E6F5